MNFKQVFRDKGSIIFGVAALCGLGAALWNCGNDTIKAVQMKKEEEEYRAERNLPPMTKKETVKICARAYIPTVISAVVTGGCMIASMVTGEKKCAAIGAACTLAETSLRTFQESAKEVLSEEDYNKVTDKVMVKAVESHPIDNSSEIQVTGKGDYLCFNTITNDRFRSSETAIRNAFNEFNARLMNEMVMTLDDLYDELGLSYVRPLGNTLCWDISDGLLYPIIKGSEELSENGEPYIIIGVSRMPKTRPTY